MLDFLIESGVVTFNYVQHVPDADKESVESGLHKLYRDSDSEGLDYRLIFHHKQLGKIAADEWQKVQGAYIYCTPGEVVRARLTEVF